MFPKFCRISLPGSSIIVAKQGKGQLRKLCLVDIAHNYVGATETIKNKGLNKGWKERQMLLILLVIQSLSELICMCHLIIYVSFCQYPFSC